MIDGLDPDGRVPIDAVAIRYLAGEMGRIDDAQAAVDDEIGFDIPRKRSRTVAADP